MALAFIPNPHNKPCVNHLDANRVNNLVGNLEWCTHRENMIHCRSLGRFPRPISDETVSQIKAERELLKTTQDGLARKYGTSPSTIGRILNGRNYRLPLPHRIGPTPHLAEKI